MYGIKVWPRLIDFARKHEVLSVSLVFLAVLLLFSGSILASEGLLNSPSSDLKIVFAGKGELFINSLKSSHLPFWDPHIQGGAPFFSNPEFTMVLYPPNLLLLSGNVTAFNFLFFAHIFLAGIFMYVFLRKKLGILASSFGSFAYMLSGYVVSTVYVGHYTQLVSLAYLPLMFYFTGRIIETGKLYYSFLFGVMLAVIFFGSHMQFFALSIIAVSLYFAFSARANGVLSAKTVFLFLLALMVFFFAASVQFLPYAEFKNFIRPYDYAAASDLSFTPLEIVKLLVPNIFGSPEHYLFVTYYWESAFYIGSLAFAMLYMLFLKRKALTPEIKFFAALLLVFLVLSFGKYLPFFRALWEYLPVFSVFRSPVRLIFLAVFSLSVLAAYAFSFFQNSAASERKKLADFSFRTSVFIAAIVVLGTALKQQLESILFYFFSGVFSGVGFVKRYSFEELLSERFYPGFNDFAFSAILTVLVLMVFYTALRLKFDKRIIFLPVALLVLETGAYSSSLLYTENTDDIFREDRIIKFLAADREDLFRVYNLKKYGIDNYELYDFFGYKYNLYNIGGDSTLTLRRYDDYFRKAASAIENNNTSYMEKMNVKYVISPFYLGIGNLSLLIDGEKAKLYRLDSYRPRAYFIKDENKAETEYSGNTITIGVSVSSKDTLVLSETYYPGWSASCSGLPKDILPREIFMSIDMEPGECNEIVFEYTPTNFYLYSALSLFSFVIFLFLALLSRKYNL